MRWRRADPGHRPCRRTDGRPCNRVGDLAPLEPQACAVVRERTLPDAYYVARVKKENPDGVASVFDYQAEGA